MTNPAPTNPAAPDTAPGADAASDLPTDPASLRSEIDQLDAEILRLV